MSALVVAATLLLTGLGAGGWPAQAEDSATAPTLVPASSSSLKLTGRWERHYAGAYSADEAATVNSGSQVELNFVGQDVTGLFDVTATTVAPELWVQVDGEPETLVTVDRPEIDLTPGLRPGAHALRIAVKDTDQVTNRWLPPLNDAVVVRGFRVDALAQLLPPPPISPVRIAFYGDSITEGIRALGDPLTPDGADGTRTYANLTARALHADLELVGFGSQGVMRDGVGNVPTAPESFPYNFQGSPADPSFDPDIIVLLQGSNDSQVSDEQFAPAYADYLREVRASAPDAWIFAMEPLIGRHDAVIKADVAQTGDSRIIYVNTDGWLNRQDAADYTDTVHPTVAGHQKVAAHLAPIISRVTGAPLLSSPVRAEVGPVSVPTGTPVCTNASVALSRVLPGALLGTQGTVLVTAPQGFQATPSRMPFSVSGDDATSVDVRLCGALPAGTDSVAGSVRVLVDGQVDVLPTPLVVSAESRFSLTPTTDISGTQVTGDDQGFSVESADFAHGFLTKPLLSQWLKTLGPRGVIRIGGYSMDLVWPAFGAYRDAPAPPQAIGGVVDQSDLDNLKALLDDTGWKVTLGVPLKSVIDPSQVKNPAQDPSPPVTLDQAVAEVKAAHETLGDDLLAVEVGNEYDNVTTLTAAQYYEQLKRYRSAIRAAVPEAAIRMAGPSANTATTNTRLNDFTSALLGDSSTTPSELLEELSSHYYPTSHCGSSTTSIPALLSASTYATTRGKLQNIMSIDARLNSAVPMVINESNSASCSGQPGVSDAYATSLWSLDYLLQAAQSGVSRVNFHTNTAAICGDFQPRDSVNYPISYRYYGAFCAADQAALDANQLSAAPLYYGLWAFRQIPAGRFVHLDLPDSDLPQLRAYGIQSPNGKLTVILINVQDPADVTSTTDAVTVNLPDYQGGPGSAVTLRSSAPGGLASTDASAVSLGGRTVAPHGTPSGELRHTAVPVADGSATIDVTPGTAQIVTFPDVSVPGAIDVTGITGDQLLAGGRANPITVSVANSTDQARTVTATVQVPDGWQAGTATETVPAMGRADLTVPVTPPLAPVTATLTGQASAPGVLGSGSAGLDVITAPSGDMVPLALDGGTTTSDVYPGYQRLSPADAWDPAKGYGWVGTPPDSRDRGSLDALRRDFVLSTTPATLRIAAPAGQHEIYVLRGDAGFSSGDTIISEDGTVLADPAGTLSAGQFQWFHFPLDGGTSGRTADLTISGAAGNYWRIVALTVLP